MITYMAHADSIERSMPQTQTLFPALCPDPLQTSASASARPQSPSLGSSPIADGPMH